MFKIVFSTICVLIGKTICLILPVHFFSITKSPSWFILPTYPLHIPAHFHSPKPIASKHHFMDPSSSHGNPPPHRPHVIAATTDRREKLWVGWGSGSLPARKVEARSLAAARRRWFIPRCRGDGAQAQHQKAVRNFHRIYIGQPYSCEFAGEDWRSSGWGAFSFHFHSWV